MKIPFSKREATSMIAAALEEGWNPLGQIEEAVFHSPQAEHILTLVMTSGVSLKMTPEAIEAAIVVAFNKDVAPVKITKPKVTEISFHNSVDTFAKVSVESEEVESRFEANDE